MKEKVIVGTKTLEFDSIAKTEDMLTLSFIGGSTAELEAAFRLPMGELENIKQLDPDGNEQTTHTYYDILSAVNKRINGAKDAVGQQFDVVDVVLLRESEVAVQMRHLEERLASVEDTTDTLVMDSLV